MKNRKLSVWVVIEELHSLDYVRHGNDSTQFDYSRTRVSKVYLISHTICDNCRNPFNLINLGSSEYEYQLLKVYYNG